MSRQGICIFFMCSVIIISFRKSLQLYCDTSSLGREEQSHMEEGGGGGKSPIFSHIPNIFAVDI